MIDEKIILTDVNKVAIGLSDLKRMLLLDVSKIGINLYMVFEKQILELEIRLRKWGQNPIFATGSSAVHHIIDFSYICQITLAILVVFIGFDSTMKYLKMYYKSLIRCVCETTALSMKPKLTALFYLLVKNNFPHFCKVFYFTLWLFNSGTSKNAWYLS